MADEKKEFSKTEDKTNKDAAIKPDPETLHTTDPQEHMKGPLSSLIHKTEETFDENDKKDVAEKQEKK